MQALNAQQISGAALLDGARTIPPNNAQTCTLEGPSWVASETYLEWARRGFNEGDDYGLSNCITCSKRAVCRRIDWFLRQNHMSRHLGRNYPTKLQFLSRVGIEIPDIVHELVIDPRNELEHTYTKPDSAEARRAMQIADLMLRATQEEAEHDVIVALNWIALGGYSSSADGQLKVDFRGFSKEPMLFIDIFDSDHVAKIVDGGHDEVRFAPLSTFTVGELEELVKLLRRHFSCASRSTSGTSAAYFRAIKVAAGL